MAIRIHTPDTHNLILASITASATWATQHDARVCEGLFPPVLWSTVRYVPLAERDVVGVKIPAEGIPVV
jgi:hypothetical protein